MCRSSPPPPTDPRLVSAANQAGNVQTAVANSYLGNANTTDPYGTTTYNQTGTEQIKDAQGNLIDVPRFSVNRQLNPAQQAILDAQNKASSGMLGLANSQIDRLGGVLGTPLDFSHLPKGGTLPTTGPQFTGLQGGPQFARLTGAGLPIQTGLNLGEVGTQFANVGGPDRRVGPTDFSKDRLRVEQAIRQRAAPQFAQQREALADKLEQQGFRRGTVAHDRALDQMGRQLNDFELATQRAGGEEQSRLAGLAYQQFGLENAAQQQAYGQALGRGTFGRESVAQNNAARAAEGAFANAAQGQGFGQRAQALGVNNQAALQEYQNEAARRQYGNQIAQLGFGNQTNLAQLLDTQRERGIQEYLLPRSTAINEIGAIRSGSQVQNPQFTPYQGGRVADTSVGANMLANDAMRNQAWQQEQQNMNATIGAVAGLGSTLATGGMTYGFNPAQWGFTGPRSRIG